ncbi:hypothetical protein [Salipiger sp.]|uniref:hypothetical protein n=1 Tax=Salipiger sp. TaxID=2078585 RepID=UPI003A96F1E1
MMTTLLAIAILSGTTLLVLGSLRSVAQDTYDALHQVLRQLRHGKDMIAAGAFAILWLLIFGLSYF